MKLQLFASVVSRFSFSFYLYLFFFLVFYFSEIQFISAQSRGVITTSHEQIFEFKPGRQTGSDAIANDLLQFIADGNNKLRVFVDYSFFANVEYSSEFIEDTLSIRLSVTEPTIDGITTYGDFNIERWLIPAIINVRWNVLNNEKEVVNELKVSDLSWQDQSDNLKFVLEQKKEEQYTLELKSIEFSYPEGYATTVDFLTESFASYYSAVHQIRIIKDDLTELENVVVDELVLKEFDLCEIEEKVTEMRYAGFHDLVRQTGSDPDNVIELFHNMERKSETIRDYMNRRIADLDDLFYKRGLEMIADKKKEEAMKSFQRAVSYNPLHLPSHLQLVKSSLRNNDVESALSRMEKFSTTIRIPPSLKDTADLAFSMIYEHEVKKANELMEDNRYLDATRLLSRLHQYCRSVESWNCPVVLDNILASAHYGMYRSYLSVAERAYLSNSYSYSVDYTRNALHYASEHSEYITSLSEAHDLLQLVVNDQINSASEFAQKGNYMKAANLLNDANGICYEFSNVHCPDDLLAQIDIMKEKQKNPANIFMEIDVGKMVQVSVDQKINIEQVKRNIEDQLSEGHLKAWAGSLDEARLILREVIENTVYYELRNDSLIHNRILSLTEQISTKECELNYNDARKLLETIENYIKNEYFIRANEKYAQLKNISQQSARCSWSLVSEINDLAWLNILSEYQQLLFDAQSAYFKGNNGGFELFVKKYNKVTSFYHDNLIAEYDVDHQSLYEFTENSANTSLVKHMIIYFAQEKEHSEAFSLLQLLKESGIDAREIKELQEKTGEYAARDFSTDHPGKDPKDYLEEITGDDEWFRYYMRSFLKSV